MYSSQGQRFSAVPEQIIEDAVKLLPIRDEPKADESLDGFLARIGELNRLDFIGPWMSSYLGMTVGHGPHDIAAIERASIATGVSVERLTQMHAHHLALTNASDRQPDDAFGRAMVYRNRRVCPGCLRDQGYQKAAFEFRFVRACPEHRTQLLDKCPACDSALGWGTPFLHRCSPRCEYDLRTYKQEPFPASDLEAQTYLLNRISGIHQAEPELLAGLSNSEVYYLVRHFGYFAHSSRIGLADDPFGLHIGALHLDGPTSLRNEGSVDLYTARFMTGGLRVLSEAPDAFEKGVNMAVARAEKRAVYIVQTVRFDAIGWAHEPLILPILERAIRHLPKEYAHLLNSHGSQGRLQERLERAQAAGDMLPE